MVQLEAPTSPVYERVGNYFFILDFDAYDSRFRLTVRTSDNIDEHVRNKDVSRNDLENLRIMLNKALGFEKLKPN